MARGRGSLSETCFPCLSQSMKELGQVVSDDVQSSQLGDMRREVDGLKGDMRDMKGTLQQILEQLQRSPGASF